MHCRFKFFPFGAHCQRIIFFPLLSSSTAPPTLCSISLPHTQIYYIIHNFFFHATFCALYLHCVCSTLSIFVSYLQPPYPSPINFANQIPFFPFSSCDAEKNPPFFCCHFHRCRPSILYLYIYK